MFSIDKKNVTKKYTVNITDELLQQTLSKQQRKIKSQTQASQSQKLQYNNIYNNIIRSNNVYAGVRNMRKGEHKVPADYQLALPCQTINYIN